MTENDLVSFKVYFENVGSNESRIEVRRFGVESNVATSYSYLTEKLKVVFPCLKDANNIQIYWKDSENDDVRICSDAELIIALTEISEPIKKLHIKMMQTDNGISDRPQMTSEGIDESNDLNLNPGAIWTCDGCDKIVEGFRYKCLQCSDYDLCSTCENKEFHPEHFMLRMPTPTKLDAWISDERNGKGGHKRWHHVSNAAAFRPCPALGSHHSKKYYKKHFGKHPMRLVKLLGDALPNVLRNYGDLIPQQAVTSQECNDKSSSKRNDSNNSCPFAASSSSTSASATKEAVSSNKASASGVTTNDPNCNNIIDSLVLNLDSVLSNVFSAVNDIQMESQNDKKESSNKKCDNKTDGENYPEKILNVNEVLKDLLSVAINELSKAQKLCDTSNNEGKVSMEGNKQEKKTDKSSPSDISANKENASSASGSSASIYPSAPTVDDVLTPEELKKVLFSDNDGIRVRSVSEEPVLQQKEAENGWTILTEEKKENASAPVNNTGAIPKTNTNVSADKSEKDNTTDGAAGGKGDGFNNEMFNSDKVTKSLRHMLAMGFTNEGNWLYDLLAAKNGDITAVIEQLVPSNYK